MPKNIRDDDDDNHNDDDAKWGLGLETRVSIPLPYEARGVSYGFKAPPAMLVLPLLIDVIESLSSNNTSASSNGNATSFPKVKFLHVVRE